MLATLRTRTGQQTRLSRKAARAGTRSLWHAQKLQDEQEKEQENQNLRSGEGPSRLLVAAIERPVGPFESREGVKGVSPCERSFCGFGSPRQRKNDSE